MTMNKGLRFVRGYMWVMAALLIAVALWIGFKPLPDRPGVQRGNRTLLFAITLPMAAIYATCASRLAKREKWVWGLTLAKTALDIPTPLFPFALACLIVLVQDKNQIAFGIKSKPQQAVPVYRRQSAPQPEP